MKKTIGLLAALTIVGAGIAVPVQAEDQNIIDVPLSAAVQEDVSQLIIKYEKNVAITQPDGEPTGSDVIDVDLDTGNSIGSGMRTVKFDAPIPFEEAQDIAQELTADSRVKFAEADRIVNAVENLRSAVLPTDSWYTDGSLWGLTGTYGISVTKAWANTLGDASVVVGVIDTGITSHSELSSNVISGYDFISDASSARDGNGRDSNPQDQGDWDSNSNSSWHGTHVAGIIGALSNNSRVVGVSPNVSIMPLRALGADGGTESDIIAAIEWGSGGTVNGLPANSNPADVLNLSLGGSGSCSVSMQTAINNAVGRDTAIVIAAGNSNIDVATAFPANCNDVITVAANATDGKRGWYYSSGSVKNYFSNYGTVGTSDSKVSIAAPGVGIYSTYNYGTTTPTTEAYASMTGTSMAAPFVAGVVALMRAIKPTITAPEIRTMIRNPQYATPFPGGNCDTNALKYCGAGIINAEKLIASLVPTPAPTPTTTINANPDLSVAESIPTVDVPAVVQPDPGTNTGGQEETSTLNPAPQAPVAATPLTFAAKKKYSAKTVAKKAAVSYSKKSTVSLKVSSGKKYCKIKSGKLQTLKAGACTVAVRVATKVKVGKKYKTKTKTTKVKLAVQ